MKAGRELDILVAEKVMGWFWENEILVSPIGDEKRQQGGVYINGIPHSLPNYSTNIADAWQVVKRMKRKKYKVEIIETPVKSFCSISDSNYEIAESEAETVPHAICLAALDAMGGGDHGSS